MPAKTTIQLRRDTAANWTNANPTLASGEAGFETDTGKFKIGDGSTAWSSLAYFFPGAGSSSNSFATISTPSGTSPVADSSTDTLTLSAGTGITITGDSSTDTVTIGTTGLISGVGTTKVSYQTTAPSSPITGDIWIDSDGSTAEVNSIQPALPMVSTHYYTAPASNSSVTASLNLAYYLPLVVVETTKFDRIAIRTASSFSGSGVVRLGIYNDSGGQPSTLVLDAGTVATSASNTAYEITISQTLSAGIYWLAFVSQTNATTNNYRATITAYYQTTHGTNTSGSGQAVGWTQGSVSGAFATASVSGANFNMPTVWLRKE